MTFDDHIAARTLWGEARGESEEGQLAVAFVIRNRMKAVDSTNRPRWGVTAAAVCLANMQFSCWNPGDPNRRKMLELADNSVELQAMYTVWLASAQLTDTTHGSQHYKVRNTYARWAEGVMPVATVGHHEFYAGVA